MNNDSSFHDAKRLYLEQYGDPMVTNTYLKIALVLLAFFAVALGLIDMRTIRTFQNFRPLVIRIDQVGRKRSAMPISNTSPRTPRPNTSCRSSVRSTTVATATP